MDGDYGVGGFGGIQELPGLDKPVIALVEGMAVGGGFELALSCDLIYAADTASFALPEINAGTLADAATLRLPTRIPHHIAMELLLTGRWMDAAEAHRWGLVNEVHPPSRLADAGAGGGRPAGRRAAAGVRGDQGGAAGEPAPDLRRGHARGSRPVGSRRWPRCTRRRTSGKAPGRSPRSAGRCGRGAEVSGARRRHGHGHGCAADHHRGEYTERQRADLDLVLAFNHRLVAAIDEQRRHHRHRRRARPRSAAVHVGGRGRRADPRPARQGRGGARQRAAAGRADPRKPRGPFRAAATRPAPPSPPAVRPPWSPGWSGRRAAATGWWPSCAPDAPRVVVAGARGPVPPDGGHHRRRCPVAGLRPVRWTPGRRCGPAGSSTAGGAIRSRSATPTAPRSTRRSPRSDDGGLHVCWQGRAAAGSPSSPGGGTAARGRTTVRVSERGVGQRLGPDASPSSGRTASPTPGPSTSTAATPSRCAASTRAAARARSGGSPAAATTRCTPAWPRPPTAACGARSTSSRCRATVAAAPPGCGPGPPARAGRRPGRHAGAGAGACRPSCCPR